MIDESDLDRDQTIALAVARMIAAARSGRDVEIIAIPEKVDRTNPAVELVTADSTGRLAIEHTLIEPYSGQIGDSHQIRPYVEALPAILADRLPAGSRFDLNLDVGEVNGVKPSSEALEAIAEWLVATAPSLVDGLPGTDGGHMARAGPPDLLVRITLGGGLDPERGHRMVASQRPRGAPTGETCRRAAQEAPQAPLLLLLGSARAF